MWLQQLLAIRSNDDSKTFEDFNVSDLERLYEQAPRRIVFDGEPEPPFTELGQLNLFQFFDFSAAREVIELLEESPAPEPVNTETLELPEGVPQPNSGFDVPIDIAIGQDIKVIAKEVDLASLGREGQSVPELTDDLALPRVDPFNPFVFTDESETQAPTEPQLNVDFASTIFADVIDANDGEISLREAVVEANNTAGIKTIGLSVGIYELSISGGSNDDISFLNGNPNNYSPIADTFNDLDIKDDLLIVGKGIGSTIIDANGIDRVFEVFDGATLTLKDLTITGGLTSLEGGGILNRGNLILDNVNILDNAATRDGGGVAAVGDGDILLLDAIFTDNSTNRDGGGLYARGGDIDIIIDDAQFTDNFAKSDGGAIGLRQVIGDINITDSNITNNQARRGAGVWLDRTSADIDSTTIDSNGEISGVRTVQGGGIWVDRGDLNLTNSTISNNDSERGGGIYLRRFNNVGEEADITNSTISGNETSKNDGGGIYLNRTTLNLSNSTVTLNESDSGGAIDLQSSSKLVLDSSIVAQNIGDRDFAGNNIYVSLGFNIIGNEDGINFTPLASDQVGSKSGIGVLDADLGALQDNGGLTFTHLPSDSSVAVDAGANNLSLTTDQRGFGREAGSQVDVGAAETNSVAVSTGGTVLTDTVLANFDVPDDYSLS